MNACHSRAIYPNPESGSSAMIAVNNADVTMLSCGIAEFNLDGLDNITNVTSTNPAVITVASHGYSNGHVVYINDTSVSAIDDIKHTISNVTTNTFEIPVDGTGWSTGGGAFNTNWNFNLLVQNNAQLNRMSGSMPENGNSTPSLTTNSVYNNFTRYGEYEFSDAEDDSGAVQYLIRTKTLPTYTDYPTQYCIQAGASAIQSGDTISVASGIDLTDNKHITINTVSTGGTIVTIHAQVVNRSSNDMTIKFFDSAGAESTSTTYTVNWAVFGNIGS